MEYLILFACVLVIWICIKMIEKMFKVHKEITINRELRRMYRDGMDRNLNGHSIEEWRLMCEASDAASKARRQRKDKDGEAS